MWSDIQEDRRQAGSSLGRAKEYHQHHKRDISENADSIARSNARVRNQGLDEIKIEGYYLKCEEHFGTKHKWTEPGKVLKIERSTEVTLGGQHHTESATEEPC